MNMISKTVTLTHLVSSRTCCISDSSNDMCLDVSFYKYVAALEDMNYVYQLLEQISSCCIS